MNILLVENHAVFAQVVCKGFLSSYTVDIVPSLARAYEALRCKYYECVFVDYDLDDGKGSELVEMIAKQYPNLKVVAISSHEQGNQAMLGAGACAVCPKMKFKMINTVLADLDLDFKRPNNL